MKYLLIFLALFLILPFPFQKDVDAEPYHIMIYTRDEGFGDNNYKDGDIVEVRVVVPDDQLSETTLSRYLVAEIDINDTIENIKEMIKPEYGVAAGFSETVIIRKSKIMIPYWLKFDADDLALIRERDTTFPVQRGVFSESDIVRKR